MDGFALAFTDNAKLCKLSDCAGKLLGELILLTEK